MATYKHIIQLATLRQLIKQLSRPKWTFLRTQLSQKMRLEKNRTNLSSIRPKLLIPRQIFVNSHRTLCSKVHSSHLKSLKKHSLQLLSRNSQVKIMRKSINKNQCLLWIKSLQFSSKNRRKKGCCNSRQFKKMKTNSEISKKPHKSTIPTTDLSK